MSYIVPAPCVLASSLSGPTCAIGPCERSQCSPATSSCNNTAVISSGQYLTPNVCALEESAPLCIGGWKGAQCKTPPNCAQTCMHGGDLGDSAVRNDTTCTGQCQCLAMWSGAQCAQCGLACQHSGKPGLTCESCESCGPGYFGKLCDCKYYTLGFRLNTDVTGWFDPTATDPVALLAQERWSKTLSVDLLRAVSTVSSSRAAVAVSLIKPQTTKAADGSAQTYVEVRLSLDCGSVSAEGGSGSGGGNLQWHYADYRPVQGPSNEQMELITHQKLAEAMQKSFDDEGEGSAVVVVNGQTVPSSGRRLLATVVSNTSSLLTTYNAFLPLLSDSASAVWQGQVTSLADESWTVTAVDTSLETTLAAPVAPRDCFNTVCDSSSNGGGGGGGTGAGGGSGKSIVDVITDSPLYLGLTIAGAVLVLALLSVGIFFLVRHCREGSDSSKALGRLAHQPSIALASNPALEKQFDSGRWNQI